MRVIFRYLFLLQLLLVPTLAWAQAQASGEAVCQFPESVRTQRPGVEQGATQIKVAVYLIDVPQIRDVDQSFVADVFLRMIWKDSRLAHGGSTCTVPASEVWNPGFFVLNQRSVERQLNDEVKIDPDGNVRYGQRIYGTFSYPADLRNFPFDKQVLPVSLLVNLLPDELVMTPDQSLLGMGERMSLANWTLQPPVASSGTFQPVPGGPVLSRFDVKFEARRQAMYYVWKLILPMSIVVMMSWAVFWLSPQHIPPRIGLSATSMLTLIAFRLALGSSLPPVSYLTQLDVFIIGATLIVFAALVETVITTALWDRERKSLAGKFNQGSRYLFPAAFLAVIVLSFTRGAV